MESDVILMQVIGSSVAKKTSQRETEIHTGDVYYRHFDTLSDRDINVANVWLKFMENVLIQLL